MRYKKINKKVFLKRNHKLERNEDIRKGILLAYSILCKVLYRIEQKKDISDYVFTRNNDIYLTDKCLKYIYPRISIKIDLKLNSINIGLCRAIIDNEVINKIVNYIGVTRD